MRLTHIYIHSTQIGCPTLPLACVLTYLFILFKRVLYFASWEVNSHTVPIEWEIYWQGKKSKIQLEQHIRLQLKPVRYCLRNLPSAPMPRVWSRSVLRAADWYLGPISAASGIFLLVHHSTALCALAGYKSLLPLVSTFLTLTFPLHLLPSASLLKP